MVSTLKQKRVSRNTFQSIYVLFRIMDRKDSIHSDAEMGLISKKNDDATRDEFKCNLNNVVT